MSLFQEFGRATANLKFESFDGGRDSRERMTQGLVVALRTAAPRTIIVVFTDNGTKDLRWIGFCVVVFNVICVCSDWILMSFVSFAQVGEWNRATQGGERYWGWVQIIIRKFSGKYQTITSQIYIVLTPEFEGYFNGKSLPAYGRMGKVTLDVFHFHSRNKLVMMVIIDMMKLSLQVFLIDEVGSDIFLKQVQEFETNNCL